MMSFELRKKFLDFFKVKKHKIVLSSSLLPSDCSVLFTTAGMQQFSKYLSGEKDPLQDFKARHLADCQKCFRSDDIEEIGDDTHNTFFEMLGNWSIGQDEKGHYFKKGAIKYALEFLINELKLDKNRFYVTIFRGNKDIPRDGDTEKIWQDNGIPKEKIKEFSEKDNLWGPVGEIGVCGSNSEIHYDRGEEFGCGEPDCGPNCSRCQRFVEIWNIVFIQYYKDEKGSYQKLSQKSVDTGLGFERVAAILQEKTSAYETDLFLPIIQELERQSSKKYGNNKKYFRIIADHIRGSVFLISEGIFPSNIEQGYVLRRILRRAIRYGKMIEAKPGFLIPLANKTIEIYKDVYPELLSKQPDILTVIQKEEEKFEKTLEKGLRQFKKLVNSKTRIPHPKINGEEAFNLYQSYGFPLEMTKELAQEENLDVDEKGFFKALQEHQEVSRAGKEKKFGGGGKFSPKLHTATHLLHSSLREILGQKVKQMGSDITSERLRFDFSFDRKLFKEEIKKVEDLVNKKIKEDLEVKKEEMPYDQAIKSGALSFFKEKYPEKVFVYSIQVFSKEICAGPHVKKTGELGKFKIIKEESSSAGIRRIKAILE